MVFEVKTTGVCEAKPNLITFNITFISKNDEYDEAVENLAKDIVKFHKKMEGYAKPEDFKTLSYCVDKRMKKVPLKDQYVFSHYEATQVMKLEIPYNKVKLFEIMRLISEMEENAPSINFVFGLANDEIVNLENECTSKALLLAEEKANAVANALKMNVVKFTKTAIVESFESYRSLSSYTHYDEMAYKCARKASVEDLSESMEPEDIRVEINMISEFEIL